MCTTDAERNHAGRPYNTYYPRACRPGPISTPGDAAIDAAAPTRPTGRGSTSSTVNPNTGETKFAADVRRAPSTTRTLFQLCADRKAKC